MNIRGPFLSKPPQASITFNTTTCGPFLLSFFCFKTLHPTDSTVPIMWSLFHSISISMNSWAYNPWSYWVVLITEILGLIIFINLQKQKVVFYSYFTDLTQMYSYPCAFSLHTALALYRPHILHINHLYLLDCLSLPRTFLLQPLNELCLGFITRNRIIQETNSPIQLILQ